MGWKHVGLLTLSLFAGVLDGCAPKTSIENLGHGYYAETKPLGKTTSEWTVVLVDKGQRRLVTQAIVEAGEIQTFMPTPFGWGCTRGEYRDSPYLASVFCGGLGVIEHVDNLEFDRYGDLLCDGKPFDMAALKRLANVQNGAVIVTEIALPIRLKRVQEFMRVVTSGKKMASIVLIPKVTTRPLVLVLDRKVMDELKTTPPPAAAGPTGGGGTP